MNILLIQLPHLYGPHYRPPTAYPLGLGYLINQLLDNNINVECLDLWIKQYNFKEMVREIKKYNRVDAIGISFYSTQYRTLKALITEIRKFFNNLIVIGGPGTEANYRIVFKTLPIDFGVYGEAEKSFINLLKNLNQHENVKGIIYKKNGEVIKTAPETYIKNLDSLKFPDRNLLDFKEYLKLGRQHMDGQRCKEGFSTNIIAGRGCPYSCNYCSKTFHGVRLRSIDNIIDEIQYLQESYNIKGVWFNDELVLVNKKRSFELCEKIKPLNIKWGCQGKLNQVNKELLEAMKNAGCVYVGYGVESVTQKMLDHMNKSQKATGAVGIINLTKKIGITPILQYMFGYAGENETSLKNSIEFFRQIDHKAAGFYTQPLPGTKLYDYCVENKLITNEETYLTNLDYGYNRGELTVNLTDFASLPEANQAIINAREIINRNYYQNHHLEHLVNKFNRLKEILKLLFLSPGVFFRKLIKKINEKKPG